MRATSLPQIELDPGACRYLLESTGPLRLEFADHAAGYPWPPEGFRVQFAGVRAGFRWTGGRLPVVVTTGVHRDHRVLLVAAPPYSRVVVALLLEVRDRTGRLPSARFPWPEPPRHLPGTGLSGLAISVRELLYRAEPDRSRRPRVQVGPAAG